MKVSRSFKTVLFCLLIPLSVLAEEGRGKLSGTVTDSKTGEALIGASVKVKNVAKGISTDIDGRYTLNSIPAGKYIIEVSYIGYGTKEITDVQVKQNSITPLNVVLEESASQKLDEVVIQASYGQATTDALYSRQKSNAAISDGVSAEMIARTPDKNTGDALKRVSGATVQDNKFVVIRGLSDRYNTAMLDGAALPSTEPNRKAFSFDIIPSSLVDNLVVNKTATPDLPGDFTGGAVQVITKDIPDHNFITLSGGASYNTASTFKNFESGKRNTINYFGFDNGNKKLSSSFPSTDQVIKGLSSEQNIAAIKSLPQDWNIYNKKALPTQNYQFTLGRVVDLADNKRFGTIVSLTYRNAQNISSDLLREYYDYNYVDNQYKFSTNIGAIANFAYTYGKGKITLKNIYNKSFDDLFTYRTGTNRSTSSDNKFYAFDLLEKSLFKSTLEGNHNVGGKSAKLNWSASYSRIVNNQPDQRKVSYLRSQSEPDGDYVASVTTLGKENTRLFSNLVENGYDGALNYSLPLTIFDNTATFKAGVLSQYRDRNFNVRFIGLKLDVINEDADAIRTRPIDQLYGSDVINTGAYTLDEIPNDGDRYTASSFTNAAYVMLDNKIGEKFRVVWGIRAEKFNLDLKTFNNLLKPVKQDYLDLLPSANLTYSLTDKTNLRASYYRTLARPEFRELSSFAYYDYEMLASRTGNPDLKRATINNLDLRYELYPSAGQIFSFSLFYKQFNNAIESLNDDYNSTRTIRYFNSKKANVYGVELEARKSLDFIRETDFLRNTTIYGNVALVKSKVSNPEGNYLEKERQMVGQAPYVVNTGLMHSFLENKLTFNMTYNIVGRRIFLAAGSAFPSMWEAPRNVLDLQLGYKVLNKKGEIKFTAGDILNQPSVLYYDRNDNKKYDGNPSDETISHFKPGSNFGISFSYTL